MNKQQIVIISILCFIIGFSIGLSIQPISDEKYQKYSECMRIIDNKDFCLNEIR